jgi:hypothetical protein
MSEQQINEILKRLGDQDKMLKDIQAQVKPVAELYSSVKGFGEVGALIIKVVLALGAVTTVIYGLIKWLKT